MLVKITSMTEYGMDRFAQDTNFTIICLNETYQVDKHVLEYPGFEYGNECVIIKGFFVHQNDYVIIG